MGPISTWRVLPCGPAEAKPPASHSAPLLTLLGIHRECVLSGWVQGLLPQGLFIPSKSKGEEVRSPCHEAAHFAGLLLFHNNRESHHCESSLHALCWTKLCTDISLVCFPGALRNIYCFCSHSSDEKGKVASGHHLSSAQLYRQRKGRVKGAEGCLE